VTQNDVSLIGKEVSSELTRREAALENKRDESTTHVLDNDGEVRGEVEGATNSGDVEGLLTSVLNTQENINDLGGRDSCSE
jgi:hypothetical protein